MSGTELHLCLPFPSLIWVLSYSPSVSRLRDIGKCDRNLEFPGEGTRCDSVLSQLCNQGIPSHNMTILYKKKAYGMTKLSNSSAISMLPCELLLPTILFVLSESLRFYCKILKFQKKKIKPSVPLLPVFLALKSPLFLLYLSTT